MRGDASDIEPGSTISCEVCIIGGGPAGITVALELAKAKLDVVLLESGGLSPAPDTQDLNAGELRGAPQFPTHVSRLRMLGGSTGHWVGMCRPLDASDFEKRPWIPNSGWPISRTDLDPWYARAHELCELGPYDYSVARWPELLKPEEGLTRVDGELRLLQLSTPTHFGERYRRDIEQAGNLRALLHSTVREIVSEPNGGAIQRVDVQRPDAKRFAVRARTFVVACGGIENARLLLLSNGTVAAGLGNERGWVGRCFMDHPAALPFGRLQLLRPEARRLVQEQPRPQGAARAVMVGLGLGRETQRTMGLLNSILYVAKPERTPDDGALGFLQSEAGAAQPIKTATCWIRAEQAPNPDSKVTLSDQLDAFGQRRVCVDWRLTDLDYESLTRSARQYIRALGAADLGRIEIDPWWLDKQPDWPSRLQAGWHHMGTTRMSGNAATGVVDRDCKVFGLDNLFVAGSSVFPTVGFANPTLTIVALALRLAAHLSKRG